jgi:transposase
MSDHSHSHSPAPLAAPADPAAASPAFAAFIGIDWADQAHAVCVLDGERVRRETLPHTPEAITAWVAGLERDFAGRPVAVMLEQSHGGLAHALMQFPQLVLFPINPKQAARYREALANSGKKDDPTDAECLARFVREHHRSLRAWRPSDEPTRQLGRLVELRRKTVEIRKQTVQQLTSVLKLYFPLALEIAGELSQPLARDLLRRWPTLRDLQRANPATLRKFFRQHGRRNEEKTDELIAQIRAAIPLTTDRAILAPNALFVTMLLKQLTPFDEALAQFDAEIATLFAAHPDAEIFRSPPGAGAALAPRLLVAFGSDRDRFASADEVQAYSGIAPITKRSGKSCHVQRRYACAKFLRQTFHEFADHARKWSRWSKAYYDYLRARGHRHHAALRALAFKWIRILFRCWKDRQPYHEDLYIQQLKSKSVPYFANIQPT